MTQDLDALPLPNVIKTSHDRIYLILGDGIDGDEDFNVLEEVTWCQDRQNETDIEYVRADVARRESYELAMGKRAELQRDLDDARIVLRRQERELKELKSDIGPLLESVTQLEEELRKAQEGREPVPPRVIELLAAIDPIPEHDSNGPGMFYCPACDGYVHMQWESGRTINSSADVVHDADCPAKWARAILSER